MLDKHHDIGAFERAAALAWTQAQVQLHHLGIDRGEAGQYQRLAGHLIYAAPMLRPPSETIESGSGGQPGLWHLGISGDLPIILVRISDIDQLDVAREALQAVEYWRMKRLAVDLVILNERASSYVQDLQIALETLVRASQSRPQIGEDAATRAHLHAARRPDLAGGASPSRVRRACCPGGSARTARRSARSRARSQAFASGHGTARCCPLPSFRSRDRPPGVEFFNGLGGFAEGGREYVTILGPGQSTPAPWINVIANPTFGFLVSAEGGGYAWSVNSREHQLTPWSNDPVTDRPGQAFYLRDEETGHLWSPTALPIRDETATYVGAPWMGLQPFRAHLARTSPRSYSSMCRSPIR